MKFYNYILLGTFLFTSIGTQISSASGRPGIGPFYRALPVINIGVDGENRLDIESRYAYSSNYQITRLIVPVSANHYFMRRDRYGRPFGPEIRTASHNFGNSIFQEYVIRVGLGTVHNYIPRVHPTDEQVRRMERLGFVYTGTMYQVHPEAVWLYRTYEVDIHRYQHYDEVNPPTRRLSSNISKGKWRLDPIEGTKQMRYYRFDMVEPVGLDSIRITFNKTYPNANIRLLNGNTTVRMIDAGYAQPNKPFVVMLEGIKVTRVEITPISSTSDIKEIHVYSTNFAHGENIQAVKGGKIVPVARYIWDPEKATDGVNDPKNDPINQWKRYVTHMSNVGTRLDLEGPHNVGYVKIAGLVGASDGIRNITVTYRDIKGAAKKVENLGFHIRNNRASTVIVEAPTKGQGSKGINDIASIDITSEDVELKYAEIEVYGPADKPN